MWPLCTILVGPNFVIHKRSGWRQLNWAFGPEAETLNLQLSLGTAVSSFMLQYNWATFILLDDIFVAGDINNSILMSPIVLAWLPPVRYAPLKKIPAITCTVNVHSWGQSASPRPNCKGYTNHFCSEPFSPHRHPNQVAIFSICLIRRNGASIVS